MSLVANIHQNSYHSLHIPIMVQPRMPSFKTFQYTTFIELSRKTHSRNQIKALDKLLKQDPTTASRYTGLVGRRFCFAFDSAQEKANFEIQSLKMLQNKFKIQ